MAASEHFWLTLVALVEPSDHTLFKEIWIKIFGGALSYVLGPFLIYFPLGES